jgi:site-specific recombinase XerD
LRGRVFGSLLGLLDCTGLRIGQALGLDDKDVGWSAGVLTVRHAKYGHARLIPGQSSTLEALHGGCWGRAKIRTIQAPQSNDWRMGTRRTF